MNKSIRKEIIRVLKNSKRPLNSRKVSKRISKRFNTSIQRVYGNLSFLSRTQSVIWVSRKAKGPSYLKV